MTIKKSDAERIVQSLSDISGIELAGAVGQNEGYPIIDIHTVHPPSPHGFKIRIQFFWRSFKIIFIPDNFALDLIKTMEGSTEGKKLFSSLANSIINDSGKIEYKINEKKSNPIQTETWEKNWNSIELSVSKNTDGIDPANLNDSEKVITELASRFLSMVLGLLPVENKEENSSDVVGYPEGALMQVKINKYERNQINRAACLSIHGYSCSVCGLLLEDKYGEIGRNCIQVHHIIPVSELGADYIIDPKTDLIPVCPNCHMILHKKNPPYTIDELKKLIKKN